MESSLYVKCRSSLALKIFNKKIVSALLIALIIIFTSCNAEAVTQKGGLAYNEDRADYSALDTQKLIYEGNSYFNQALQADKKYYRDKNLNLAMGKYYLVSEADNKNVYVITQMARIYSLKNEDRYAREYFFKAVNLDRKNPNSHYHFGEFYYKKKDLDKALKHYLIAYENGYQNNFNLNCRLGLVYEKLADLEKAKLFYQAALKINPQKTVLNKKIQNITALNYDKTEYYQTIRE